MEETLVWLNYHTYVKKQGENLYGWGTITCKKPSLNHMRKIGLSILGECMERPFNNDWLVYQHLNSLIFRIRVFRPILKTPFPWPLYMTYLSPPPPPSFLTGNIANTSQSVSQLPPLRIEGEGRVAFFVIPKYTINWSEKNLSHVC